MMDRLVSPSAPNSLSVELLEEIQGIRRLFRKRQNETLRECAPELTPMEGRLLSIVHRSPGCTLAELVTHFGRDKAQLARLVASLRERGLIVVRANASDRRIQPLHLTHAGEALQQVVQAHRLAAADLAVNGLTPEACAALLGQLRQMRANLES